MKMTKTALTRAPKAKLVDELLQANKQLEETNHQLSLAISEKVDLEVTVRNIMFHLEELLDNIDLPRKFSFMWIVMNFSKLAKFLQNVLATVRDAKENKLSRVPSEGIIKAPTV